MDNQGSEVLIKDISRGISALAGQQEYIDNL